jgi:hypothetical protein
MSSKTIEVGSAKAGANQRSNGYLNVGDLPDGSPINLPVMILNGANSGPVLWLHGLEDGNEYPGCMACIELAKILTPQISKMNGAVVMLPAVNITAFRGSPWGGGIRNATADLDGGFAFPRAYPGDPNRGFTHQAAGAVWSALTKYATHHITFHGSGEMYGVDRVLTFSGPGKEYEETDRVARAFGMRVLLRFNVDPSKPRMADEALIEKGVPVISGESNGGPNGIGLGWDCSSLVNGTLNVMKYLKIIDGEAKLRNDYLVVTYKAGGGGVFSHRGGFFHSHVKVLEKVSKDQTVGEIHNFFGETVENVKSPVDGVVLGYWGKCPQIGSGQYRVFEIASPV